MRNADLNKGEQALLFVALGGLYIGTMAYFMSRALPPKKAKKRDSK